MADNIVIPASGTGTAAPSIATDEISGQHYQRMKLDVGAEGSAVLALGDSTGRLLVCPSSNLIRVAVTPTIDTSAHVSGDYVGGLQDIANAARVSGGSGVLQAVTVFDRAPAQRMALDLVFFDRSVTTGADNAAWAVSDTDMGYCLGIVSIGPYNAAFPATVLNCISTLLNINLPYVLNGTSLYCQAIDRATGTWAVGDLTFTYTLYRD